MRRIGRKKIPVYSIVATDSRNARDGRYIEDLGRYYPLREPAEVKLDEERALYWLENGAQPSDTVRSILYRRGLLLQKHLKKKGESPDEIETAVQKHRERMAEQGDEIKMAVQAEGEDALAKERERAEDLDEEAKLRAQATSITPDEPAQEETATAEADDETEAAAEADDQAPSDPADAEADDETDEEDA
jgi:small subunit ribosomal protein S16